MRFIIIDDKHNKGIYLKLATFLKNNNFFTVLYYFIPIRGYWEKADK